MGTWDKIRDKKKTQGKAPSKIGSLPQEMRDEIMAIREKKKQFEATNNAGYYCCILFSTDADAKKFVQSLKLPSKPAGDFFLDGYVVAKRLGLEPQAPAFKLPAPLDERAMKD